MNPSLLGTVRNPVETRSDPSFGTPSKCRLVLDHGSVSDLLGPGGPKYIQVVFGRPDPDKSEAAGLDAARVEILDAGENWLEVRGPALPDGSPVYGLKRVAPSLGGFGSDGPAFERIRENPREEMTAALKAGNRIRCLLRTASIHGHFCPGSALGVMASMWGLEQLGLGSPPSDGLENLMAVVETNACFADGVQTVSGCTLGNNALVYRDLGRHAVTFAHRGLEEGVRVRVRADFQSRIAQAVPEFYPLLQKVIIAREGTAEEEALFKKTARKAAFSILEEPFREILVSRTVRPVLPDYAPITASAVCSDCQEQVMATKIVIGKESRELCFECAGIPARQVDGRGIWAP